MKSKTSNFLPERIVRRRPMYGVRKSSTTTLNSRPKSTQRPYLDAVRGWPSPARIDYTAPPEFLSRLRVWRVRNNQGHQRSISSTSRMTPSPIRNRFFINI